MTPELKQRAEAHGLVRREASDLTRRAVYAVWRRGVLEPRSPLVEQESDTEWFWAPEHWNILRTAIRAGRYPTEAEALSAALAWLDAGEPAEVTQ